MFRTPKTHRAITCLALAALASGCSSDSGDENTDNRTMEIFSWWTAPGEVDALSALLAVHQERNPDFKYVNLAANVATNAREVLETRMTQGQPPDTFQANIGADLFKWVNFNQIDDSDTKLEPLDAYKQANGWDTGFPPEVIEALSSPASGKLYGVPVNIHRINAMFFDKKFIDEHDLTVPETLDDLEAFCENLPNIDPDRACLAIGNKYDWTMALFALEMVLPAVGGVDFYESYWTGNEDPGDDRVVEALDRVLALWPHFNADANEVDWSDAVDKLVRGEAVFAPMGDWAKGYLQVKGLVPGVDFGQVAFPGSDGFVFTADCFPLPKGAPSRAQALKLLATFGSVEGQVAFNRIKGSIPARIDASASDFDEVAQHTMLDFDQARGEGKLVRALSGLTPPDMPDNGPIVKEMLISGDTQPVLFHLENSYGKLQR